MISWNIRMELLNTSPKRITRSHCCLKICSIYISFRKKRQDAVNIIINMITSPGTNNMIHGMIKSLQTIAGEIYPETIFGPLSGKPICTHSYPNEDKHYQSDGYPVLPQQMNDYTCLRCKVALLFGCLSAYHTSSLHYDLNWYL